MNAQQKAAHGYRDPDPVANHALAGALAGFTAARVLTEDGAVDVGPVLAEADGPAAETVVNTIAQEAVVVEPETATSPVPEIPAAVAGGDTALPAPAEGSAVVSPEVSGPETSLDTGGDDATPVVQNTRTLFHEVTRAHVAAAQKRTEGEGGVHFTVAPPEPERTRKPKQLSKDAPWERVTLRVFQKSKSAEMVSLVRAIRAGGLRPVVTLEIRAPEGAGTRVDFGLSIAVEKGGYEHVKLTPLDGAGLFGWLFQSGVAVFHDEVMGEKSAQPDRYLATVGVNSAMNMVASFLEARRATRPQR